MAYLLHFNIMIWFQDVALPEKQARFENKSFYNGNNNSNSKKSCNRINIARSSNYWPTDLFIVFDLDGAKYGKPIEIGHWCGAWQFQASSSFTDFLSPLLLPLYKFSGAKIVK